MRQKILSLSAFLLLFSALLGQEATLPWYQESWQNGLKTGRGLWQSSHQLEARNLYFIGGAGVALAITFQQDGPWQAALSAAPGPGKDAFARYVAEPFGNPYWVGGVLLSSYALSHWGHHPQWRSISEEALQSVVAASFTTLLLKMAFHRERPREQSQLDPYRFHGPSFRRQNLSFPSGHATVAFALASSLSMHFEENWYWGIPLYGLAAATAWQRVYQQEHWPSDVLMGALIGSFIGVSNHYWQQGKRLHWSAYGGSHSVGLSLRLDLDPPDAARDRPLAPLTTATQGPQ